MLGNAEQRRTLVAALIPILQPTVTRFLPPSWQFDPTPDTIDAWIEQRRYEAAIALVRRIDTQAVAGILTVREGDAPDTLRFGYLFAEDQWGQGFATELVMGLAGWATDTGVTQLIAGVEPDNAASSGVLIKVGFEPAGAAADGVDEYRLILDEPAG